MKGEPRGTYQKEKQVLFYMSYIRGTSKRGLYGHARGGVNDGQSSHRTGRAMILR